MKPQNSKPATNKLSLSLDLRLISLLLLAVIAAMLLLWKPWEDAPGANDRTVQVTGEAKVKAEPDQFTFYPAYEFLNADKAAALAEMTAKSNQIVAELKKLGVADNKIKTNADGYRKGFYVPDDGLDGQLSYNLQITVSVSSKEMAQKVQDYLVSTTPGGNVTPQPTFSDDKRKSLEKKARDEATKDARSKAEQSAKNLGYSIGRVKAVTDGAGSGPIMPLLSRDSQQDIAASSPSIQPGEDELNYLVTVTYYIK